jgi:hypothetical protein
MKKKFPANRTPGARVETPPDPQPDKVPRASKPRREDVKKETSKRNVPARKKTASVVRPATPRAAKREFPDTQAPDVLPPTLGELDLHLFGEGRHELIYEKLGAHPITHEGKKGVSFAVWAPAAEQVSLVGNFNNWDGTRNPMHPLDASGVW